MGIPAALLLPALAAAAIVAAMGSGRTDVDLTSIRGLRYRDTAIAALLVGIFACFLLAGSAYPFASARNLVGFTALGLLGGRADWKIAPTIPVAYGCIVAVLGNGARPDWWAWCIEPQGRFSYTIIASTLAAVVIVGGVPERTILDSRVQ